MNWMSLTAAAAAFCLAGPVLAQKCPRERAVTVAQTSVYGASVTCSGLSYSIPGLTITTTTGCPLFVTVTPDHEVAMPATSETMVRAHTTVPGKIIFFQCRTSYLIFIPISSTCAFEREVNFGAFSRMTTIPCPEAQG